MNDKVCEQCQKSYKPKKEAQRFCVRSCFVEYQRAQWATKNVSTACSYCGIELKRLVSQTNFKRLYCSIEHKQLGSRKGWEVRQCKACGEDFKVRLSEKAQHCSVLHGMWTRTDHSLLLLPIRLAWEKDPDSLLESIRDHCTLTEKECWVPSWTDESYPYFSIPGINETQLHRITITLFKRPPKDSLEQAHHACANTRCVNPEHLQWLSPHDNLAEMKERGRYTLRIQRLEQALYEISPNHPLLRGFDLSENK